MKKNKKVIMLILDGWGLGKKDKFNAIDNAKTPNFDKLVRDYPNVSLRADGESVGLPEGQFGTSEINHMVIGTGQVVLQDLPRIDKSIEDKTFFSNPALIGAAKHTVTNKSKLHLVGIISDGKVHASLEHVLNLIKLAGREGVEEIHVHAFTDGRDVPPKSAEIYLREVEKELKNHKFKKASIATMQGRFFLDRDREWSRTEKAVDLLVKGEGRTFSDYQAAINFYYNQNQTDEFFEQVVLDPNVKIGSKDSVIFFH